MATKTAAPASSTKRKGGSSDKHPSEKYHKKAKTVSSKKKPEASDSSDSSDSGDDGGVELASKAHGAKTAQDPARPKPGFNAPGKPAEHGLNAKESHAKQKQLALERRNAKPLADEVQRTKKLWERLRRKSHVPKEERQQLVDELYGIISGRVKDFVLKHDAVRAVQTAIKYSTPDQRKAIAKELQGTYAQLAESRYAKFLIGKLLVQNDAEIRDIIVPEFYGKVRKLINHSEASWILDDIYRGVATKEQKAHLLREWYGPEFSLFRQADKSDVTGDLSAILAAEPSKRTIVLKYLCDMTNALIQKKLTGFTMLHDAMLQYFLNLHPGSEELKEFGEVVRQDENGDLLKNMAFTKSGARLVCLLLAHGSAKDRKNILKIFKDTFQPMCGDTHGHMIILAAYDLLDDTVLTAKTIFPEILGKNEEKDMENVTFLANDLNARITICYLFEGQSRSLFPASHANDLEILNEIHEIRKTTSKKDPEIRRKELVGAMSAHLLSAVASSANELVQTSFGCQFVTDVLLSTNGDKTSALAAVAATAAGDSKPATMVDTYLPAQPHISLTPHGGKMYRTLIAGGRFDKSAGAIKRIDPPLNFADVLYPIIKEHVLDWATGPSSFTVLALLEAPDFSSSNELLDILRSQKKSLKKAATEGAPKTEVAEEEEKPKSKAKRAKKGPPKPVGNQGTRLLLEKL
ncbi:armadillo-type protein [Podospora didyma]|uniref:Armadillo-type protein n=1 Tax=Podospora didyma TaxID=330526 RepID=A0AAE0P769_9PEZI|nr:armadillo-type protein [Podospora didyma]